MAAELRPNYRPYKLLGKDFLSGRSSWTLLCAVQLDSISYKARRRDSNFLYWKFV